MPAQPQDQTLAPSPADADWYDRNQVAFAQLAVSLLMAGPAILIALLLAAGEPQRLWSVIPFAVVGVLGWIFLQQGWRQGAFKLLVFGVWTCCINALFLTNGLTGSTTGILIAMLAFTGWLAGPIPAIILTAATPPVLYLMAYLEVTGWPIALGGKVTPYQRALVFSVTAVASGALGYFGAASLRERFEQLLGTQRDLSLKLAELQARDEELRIAAVAFDSQECMMVTGADNVILRVNRAFTETTGYTPEEAVGQTPGLLKSGRHNAEFYRAMWQTVTATGSWSGEIWDRRKNGEEYPKWLTVSAVKDDAGAVTHYIGTFLDITTRKEAEDRINELAFFDQLTGLPNRTLLRDRLKQAIAASTRGGAHGALLFLDLDNFKTLNDTLGHAMGDLLLKQVAQRLTSCVREGDTVARLGGDEFVVVLAGLSRDAGDAASAVEAIAAKLLAALTQPYPLGAVSHRCTASIGVTLFNGEQASIDELLKQADLSMYKAKAGGRNAVCFFDPTLESAVKERVTLEADLRRALDEGQFLLHYQAQMSGERRLTGAEVLVRWQHPARGVVSPADFIPLAEESGLILRLGQWVLETACRQLAAWAAQPALAPLTVAVNVSARQFHQADFVAQVLAVLAATGADPRRLKLELTESLLVANVEDVVDKMHSLKAVGVGFSLDDFGTGYSSLSYLSRLPLDQLKIDRSFVMNIESDDSARAICAATISLAHNLRLKVVAEGVETEAQLRFLNKVHRCDLIQGYLFGRPLPIAEFEALAAA